MLGVPGIQRKGVQIGTQIHIGLLDADKALDGGAVEHTLIIQRFFHLAGGNGHVLQRTENIGELQTDKFNVLFFDNTENVLFGITAHGHDLLFSSPLQQTETVSVRRQQEHSYYCIPTRFFLSMVLTVPDRFHGDAQFYANRRPEPCSLCKI